MTDALCCRTKKCLINVTIFIFLIDKESHKMDISEKLSSLI